MKNKKQILTTLLSILLPVFLVSAVAYATTVGNDVSVGNDLTVTGALTANGDVTLGNAAADTITINGKVGTITLINGETIDNTTDGLVTVTGKLRVNPVGLRSTTDTTDQFLRLWDGGGLWASGGTIGNPTVGSMTGGVAQKTYAAYIDVTKPSGSPSSGDSNDAAIRVAFNNVAANDANYIMRGINIGVNNKNTGVVGRLEGALIGSQSKGGTVSGTNMGMTIVAENYGTVSDLFGGIDLYVRNEAAVATDEFGIRIRNDNQSTASAVDAGIVFTNNAVNTGFTYGIDMNGVEIATADIRLSNGGSIGKSVNLIPVRPSGDYAYLFNINDGGGTISSGVVTNPTVGSMTGTTAQKTYAFNINVARPTTAAATGDSNDSAIKVAYNNVAVNDANFVMRAFNGLVANRNSGVVGTLEAGSFGAQAKSGTTASTVRGLTITPENYGTVSSEFGGIDVVLKNEGAQPATSYGLRVRNMELSSQPAIAAGLLLSNAIVDGDGNPYTSSGFTYGIDMNSAKIGTADIRLSSGVTIATGTGDPTGAVNCTKGNIFIRTNGAADSTLYICVGTNDWDAVDTTPGA